MRAFCERARFFGTCLFVLPLLVLAIGCGKKEGTLSGKVYYKGQPLKAGTISFFPEGKGGRVGSEIKEDGSYTVSKVPPGMAKISIEIGSPEPPTAAMPPGMAGSKAKEGMKKQQEKLRTDTEGKAGNAPTGPRETVKLPEKYNDPEQSGLTVNVTGGKQSFDVKID